MEELLNKVKDHPFFQGVKKEEALSLLKLCHQRSYKEKEVIFEKKQREGLLLLLTGMVEVYVSSSEREGPEEVLDIVQGGELIGFSSLAEFLGVATDSENAGRDNMVKVRAVAPTEALFVPFCVITKRWGDPNVHDYLLTQTAIRLRDIYESLAEQVNLARKYGESDAVVIRVQDIMSSPAVTVGPKTKLSTVARTMIDRKVSSVLVVEKEILQGIITDRDLLERVIASSPEALSKYADEIMTRNPLTISRVAYYYDALATILLGGVKHLPVTDGESVVGVVTLSDLLRKKSENVIKTLHAIDQSDEHSLPRVKEAIYEVLNTLLASNVPVLNTLDVITSLYDRLISRCVEMAISIVKDQTDEVPPVSFCLYQMGSGGRREQFLLTDQDHFLVYEDSKDDRVNRYFEVLSDTLVNLLETAGYERCKGNMMANYPNWRGPISFWQERVRTWSIQVTNANLLLAQNFLSYRLVYGDTKVHNDFEHTLTQQVGRSKILLYRLTELEKEAQIPTLDQPIRSLLRMNRKQLDIKKEVLFPYHHSLQILSLRNGILSGTPFARVEKLVEKNALSESFAKDITIAVSEILQIYVKHRWHQYKNNENLTSTIQFSHLSSREKDDLILSLKTLKNLQNLVFAHYY